MGPGALPRASPQLVLHCGQPVKPQPMFRREKMPSGWAREPGACGLG